MMQKSHVFQLLVPGLALMLLVCSVAPAVATIIPGSDPDPYYTPIYPNPGGEPDLLPGLSPGLDAAGNPVPANPYGNVMDHLYGPGNYTRISDSIDQIWQNSGGGTSEARAKWAGNEEYLYYSGYVTGQTLLLDVDGGSGYLNGPWAALPSVTELFTWKLYSGGNWFSSDPSQNGGDDHMVTFEITGNAGMPDNVIGDYVIAWEDLPFSSSDKDYQDLVVEVRTVPEPSSVIFIAGGVLTVVAGVLRKKMNRPPAITL